MRINKENIEELMFQYHEGVLNESAKKQVLAYISRDEELTEAFRLWSVTKLAANPSYDYPDLSEKLFKKDPFYKTVQFKSITYFLLGAMLAGFVCWWFWGQKDPSLPDQNTVKNTITAPEYKASSRAFVVKPKLDTTLAVVKTFKKPHHHKIADSKPNPVLADSVYQDEVWTAAPVPLEAISLQDSVERNRQAFDSRQLTYPKQKLNIQKVSKTIKAPKKSRINLKPQWKFKEEDANF